MAQVVSPPGFVCLNGPKPMLNTAGRAVGVARRRSSGAVAQRFPSSGLVSQDPNAIWGWVKMEDLGDHRS